MITTILELPFETYESDLETGRIQFVVQFQPFENGVESITPKLIWPKKSLLQQTFKTPAMSNDLSMREYIDRLQTKINQEMSKTLKSNAARERFIETMVSKFKPYVLDYDDLRFTYLSIYIIISTPATDTKSEDVLGAAVVNGTFF